MASSLPRDNVKSERFPYTNVPKSLREFLKGIPDRAVPERVSNRYLVSIGMKSSNDRTIIPVLKFVRLLNESGVPTDDYRQFKDRSKGPGVLAQQIRAAYASLYSTYEDAHNRSTEDLQNFFGAKTGLGSRLVNYQVATFKALCDFADFGAQVTVAASPSTQAVTRPQVTYPEIHMNLQIYLPDAKDPTVYERIFQAIAKYLLKGT